MGYDNALYSLLDWYETRVVEDSVDLMLTCTKPECEAPDICLVEPGDTMSTFLSALIEHHKEHHA